MPDRTLAGLITQSSLLKALDPNEIQQVVELLQQDVDQLLILSIVRRNI